MKPAAVLDMQADLFARLDSKTEFAEYIEAQLFASHSSINIEPIARQNAKLVVTSLTQHVKMADAYRVTDEMSMLVQFAASKLDDSDKIDRTLTPTPWGIVRFDRPLPIKDARGKMLLAHWLTWGPIAGTLKSAFGHESTAPGLLLSWWNDAAHPDDVELMKLGLSKKDYNRYSKIIGRWALCGAEMVLDGSKMGGPLVPMSEETQARIIADGDTPEPYTNTARYAHALFMLLNQTIVTTTEDELPRSAARRIGRMPIPGRISVITLRRSSGSKHEGETAVEWAHRWLVRGFMAWRACSPDYPQAQPYEKGWRVRVYISPYVKGPADKPLVVTQKLYNLTR